MAIIKWSDSLSVSMPEIDRQHQKLIELINELNEAMKEGKGKKILGNIITGLISYTRSHFTDEENYFKRYNYPDADLHVAEHKKFVQTVKNFQHEFNEGKLMLTIDVMNFLSDWLMKHIKGSDQKYSQFFTEKGVI